MIRMLRGGEKGENAKQEEGIHGGADSEKRLE
jgi:hypothetical protein